jgi:hypothetical protein
VLVTAVVLTIALVSLATLAVLMLSLIRHLKVLSAALKRFQDDLQPVLEDLRAGSAQAQDHLARLQRQAAERSGSRTGLRRAGAKLRR